MVYTQFMDAPAKLRKERFSQEVGLHGKNPAMAYMEIWGAKKATAQSQASRLLKEPEVQEAISDLREVFKTDAQLAYSVDKSMMMDTKTPANVRHAIAKDIMDRAGYAPTQKTENTTEVTYPEIDNISPEGLKDIIDESHAA